MLREPLLDDRSAEALDTLGARCKVNEPLLDSSDLVAPAAFQVKRKGEAAKYAAKAVAVKAVRGFLVCL